MRLGGKQRRTLELVYRDPAPADLRWADLESLLQALGAELSEGRGSRLRVHLSGVRAVFHRPHPGRIASRSTVRSLRRFLRQAGARPEE